MLRYLSKRSLSSSTLQRAFEAKLEFAKNLPELNDNHKKLQMYALYKQATMGPASCTPDAKPGMFDMVGKFKWDAWNNLGTLSSEQAMQDYMSLIDGLTPPPSNNDSIQELNIGIHDHILSIQLNRPDKFNALNWDMYTAIQDALNKAKDDDSVHAVVLSGTGPFFCSGNDLTMFTKTDIGPKELASEGRRVLAGFVDAFILFPKPIVAAVHGPAIGISVTILALCDLVYASQNATFQTPFAPLGQSPEACSSLLFPAIFGPAKANSMLFLGNKLSAQEACEYGLVSETFGADFQHQVDLRVKQLAAMPPKALQRSKKLIRSHSLQHLLDINRKECELLEELWVADECLSAITAFSKRSRQ